MKKNDKKNAEIGEIFSEIPKLLDFVIPFLFGHAAIDFPSIIVSQFLYVTIVTINYSLLFYLFIFILFIIYFNIYFVFILFYFIYYFIFIIYFFHFLFIYLLYLFIIYYLFFMYLFYYFLIVYFYILL